MSEVLDIAKRDGRWTECPGCSEIIITERLNDNFWICPHCDYHLRLKAAQRINMVCDPESFRTLPLLEDDDYEDGIMAGYARIDGRPCCIAVMDFSYRGGTMGVMMAEVIVQVMQAAHEEGCPLLMFCASGGVRVQEGIMGLMQMLRTSHARNRTRNVPMVTIFTDPTLGGVTASFASLSDLLIAEPGCRIGFAGARVIESTINYELPPDFQDARRLLKNGFLDNIVHRSHLRETLAYLLEWF